MKRYIIVRQAVGLLLACGLLCLMKGCFDEGVRLGDLRQTEATER